MSVFAALFLIWMLFNGKWTPELAVVGLILSAVFYAAICRLTGAGLFFDLRLLRKVPAALELFAVLLAENLILLLLGFLHPKGNRARTAVTITANLVRYAAGLFIDIREHRGQIARYEGGQKLPYRFLDLFK